MTAEPNPYRCQTCKFSKITTKTYDDYGDITTIFCNKINREIDLLTCEHPHWFFDVGCSSHSSFQNRKERDYQDDDCIWMTPEEEENRIRKHERTKVLDELIEWLYVMEEIATQDIIIRKGWVEKENESIGSKLGLMQVKEKVERLRHGGNQP